MIENLIRGDTIYFEVKADEDITNWKIRAQLWDSGSVDIKKATANSGGADSQIEVTNATDGVFLIKIEKGETTSVLDEANLEIEVETNDSPTKIYTVYRSIIKFTDEKITWSTP